MRWIAGKASPAFASDGAFTGYIGSCLDITEQKDAQLGMDKARLEVRRLREQLRSENGTARRDVVERPDESIVLGQSAAARLVMEQIEQVASTDSTVLLLGETGTGKELCATQIHERSTRHARAMVRVNCAVQDYFDRMIKPHIDGKFIEFVGEVDLEPRTNCWAMRWPCCFLFSGMSRSAWS